jgi:hypothetical protein
MCNLVACSSDVARCSRPFLRPRALSQTAVPPDPIKDRGSRSRSNPLQSSSTSSRPTGLSPAPTSLRFLVPSTTSPELAPHVLDRPGPARFRSQALSASQRFPGRLELATLSDRCRPWALPLQSLPLAEIARPSRGPLAPLQSVTDLRERDARAVHRRFPPLPRRSTTREVSLRSRLVPPSAMGSLSTRLVHDLSAVRLRASRSPRAHAPGSLVPVSSTCFGALIPPSSPFARWSVSRASAVAALLGFAPLELSSDQAPDPA